MSMLPRTELLILSTCNYLKAKQYSLYIIIKCSEREREREIFKLLIKTRDLFGSSDIFTTQASDSHTVIFNGEGKQFEHFVSDDALEYEVLSITDLRKKNQNSHS